MTSGAPGTVVLAHSSTGEVFNRSRGPVNGHVVLARHLFATPSAAPHAKNVICAVRTIVRSVPLGADLDFLRGLSVLALGSDRKALRFGNHGGVAKNFNFTLLHPNGATQGLRTHFHSVGVGRRVCSRRATVATSPFKGGF